MGNLAFTNTLNQLTISNIHKMSTCRLFEKFTAKSRQCLGQPQNKEASPKERFERSRAAASEKAPSKGVTRHPQMPAEEQRSGGHALWCARRPDVPP